MEFDQTKSSVSRRRALTWIAAIPAVAVGLAGTLSSAQAADMRKTLKYQDKPGPKGAKCSGCRFFKKPNGCTIISGKISPNGWCTAYASK